MTLGLLAAPWACCGRPSGPGVGFGVALLAFVIVLSQVVNDPPAVAGPNGSEQDTGIWLALAGTALMVAGAVLSSARIAIAVEPRARGPPAPPPAPAASEEPTVRAEPPRSDPPPTSP